MRTHTNSKFRPKYSKQLRNGLRADGKSIREICSIWGITKRTYENWRKAHPSFEEAHEIGENDKASWWHKTQRSAATGEIQGNATLISQALKNECDYVDKVEVHNTHDEKITTIRIEMLPSRDLNRIIDGTFNKVNEESNSILSIDDRS